MAACDGRAASLRLRQLGPDSVLLTAGVRFARRFNLDKVEQAIERLESGVLPYIHTRRIVVPPLFLPNGGPGQQSDRQQHE